MLLLDQILPKKPIFYIARDFERAAAGLNQLGIFIISNLTEYSKKAGFGQEKVLLVDEGQMLDTWQLLEHPLTTAFIAKHSQTQAQILVFKNTSQIERICEEKGYALLNPPAALSTKIEEKISQVAWLGDLEHFLPPHTIDEAKNISFTGTPFILQFNRAHTGLGTMLIESVEQLTAIQQKFPNRPVRITQFIDGPMLTSNNVVGKDAIFVGNISYQITGLEPFTENRFTTIGNDWELPHQLFNDKLKADYHEMVEAIGKKLRVDGWKGLFGVDIVFDEHAQKLYLIEINARQPASTTFESVLQGGLRTTDYGLQRELTMFEAHIAALLDIPFESAKCIEIKTGAQIIQRVTENIQENKKEQTYFIGQLQNLQQGEQSPLINIIPYQNTESGADWLRVQLSTGIMKAPDELNEIGLKIEQILHS